MRIFGGGRIAFAALFGLALASRSAAFADQLVNFHSAAPIARQSAGRLAGDGAKTLRSRLGAPIRGYLTKPEGQGPFPAVVLMHSCLGLPRAKTDIGEMLAEWGYVALFVDEFATRGINQTCASEFGEGVADALGALLYLSNLPYVDRNGIAVVGYSQGADTALQIASRTGVQAFAIPAGLRFIAAAAFYPPCDNQRNARLSIPTLILIGASDDVTPAADCERLMQNQSAHGSDFKLAVYPRAFHLFDDPALAAGMRLDGMWLKYDAAAAEQSKADLHNFLAATIGR